jgi:hypothetical protein
MIATQTFTGRATQVATTVTGRDASKAFSEAVRELN